MSPTHDFRPNSHRYQEEQKEQKREKVGKIVKGAATTKKKGDVRKLADVFISEDVGNVKSYILSDVLVPAVKKLVSDIVKDGIEMLLFGGTGRSRRSSAVDRVSYRSYDKIYDRRDYDQVSVRSRYSYDDVVLETRGEAEEVLSAMDDLIESYGNVSIADMYDLVGITGNYTDYDYGWTNIRTAEVVRLRNGGYMLKMPRAVPLK